ncbi:hypothetical protein ANCCAN_13079 [Ancylostoma caninum]|uniref:Helitron helicase-like domain-containing protein n=1 Tax=Ancylostoma caninum TaxID=29170 RepID=A0A368G990_ANCCA|nr:hypothetical protein ANCCAN_13079 [Ancylostoma caninum]
MQQSYQDAMAIVARYGKPTYFLTMTCNPQWREIQENLYDGQVASDRPDLIARVFNGKLKELCDDLLKKKVLGEVEAYVYVIESQKRGLPHCHMLLIMKERWKVRTVEDVDNVVCAELPSREEEPEAYAAITSYMIHRKCGVHDPHLPCMREGKCSKHFPKPFQDGTAMEADGYPSYRRRNLFTAEINEDVYTDEWVVPTNLYLTKFNCNVNLEICGTISAVKYLYKYIYKGPDRARIFIESALNDEGNPVLDEIKQHLTTRYDSKLSGSSLGRNNGLWNALRVPLTAYFELNRQCANFFDGAAPSNALVDARDLYYYQIPEYFTFTARHGWRQRQRGGKEIGRMYTVSPRDVERYSLRILLLNTKGKTSFEDLQCSKSFRGMNEEEAIAAAYFEVADRMLTLGRDLRQIVAPPAEQRLAVPDIPIDHRQYEREGS